MRRRFAVLSVGVSIGVACAALAVGAGTASAGPAGPAGPGAAAARIAASPAGTTLQWTGAAEVPGLAALNRGGYASFLSVSCASAGDCAAGGYYSAVDDGHAGNADPFVVNEVNGTWRAAREVPGMATIDAGGDAEVLSVSCASAGNCSAGGYYSIAGVNATFTQPFVVNQIHGTWGTIQQVTGMLTLNAGGDAEISSVSCGSAGNCAAGGFYTDGSGAEAAYVVNETDGRWGPARALPGGPIEVTSVSCASAGNCVAGGADNPDPGGSATEAYVAAETDGTWHAAAVVPGVAALTTGDVSIVNSVSCASAGNCAVGGYYATAANGTQQAFVANEVAGTWGNARQPPGLALLNAVGGQAQVTSVSCASPGSCAAGGAYQNATGFHSFVAAETGGGWRAARSIPDPWALTTFTPVSVSCGSTGNCSAVGSIWDYQSGATAFVVTETNGSWGGARPIPWAGATPWYVEANSVSCVRAGECSVGGFYFTDENAGEAFVGNKSLLTLTAASLSLSATKVTYGHEHAERLKVTVASKRGGTPTGTVTVTSGKTAVCVIKLASGKGACTLSPAKLKPGTYHLEASYRGSAEFAASASAAHPLTVAK